MKNKLSNYFLALILISAPAIAQNKETRTVEKFTKLAFRLPGKLYLRQGTPQKVELEGPKEVLAKIETEVEAGKLSIGNDKKWRDWNWKDGNDLKVFVTVENIEAISVSGSGDLIAETKLTGGSFNLNVSGSGSLNAEIEATGDMDADVSGSGDVTLKGKFKSFDSDISGSGGVDLTATVTGDADFHLSGSGEIKASGSAKNVKATISGSGKVLASNFETETCKVHISGSGDVEINVKDDLDASISGSGTVSYKGNPNHVNSNASGSGHVRKM